MIRNKILGIMLSIVMVVTVFAVTVSMNVSAYPEGWSDDTNLSNDSTDSVHSAMYISPDGDIHIVWADGTLNEYGILVNGVVKYQRSEDNGETWNTPVIFDHETFHPRYVDFAGSGDHLFITWEGYSGPGGSFPYVVYVDSFDGGMTWTMPEVVGMGSDIAVAVDGDFDYIMYRPWKWTGSPDFITRPNKVIWTDGVTFGSYSLGVHGASALTVDNGHIHATVAEYFSDDPLSIKYAHSLDNGITWSETQTLSSYSGLPGGQLDRHPVSLDVDDNNVQVVWNDDRSGNYDLYLKYSLNSGITWSSDISITSNSGSSLYPVIAIDSILGNYETHIFWQDDRDGNFEIYYEKLDGIGNTIVDDLRFTDDSASSEYPNLAISENHIVNLVWQDDRDGNLEIYYKHIVFSTDDIDDYIQALPDDCFKNANNKNTLSNKLSVVQNLIDDGKYQQAINKLENDILPKVDGVGSNDWVTCPDAQDDLVAMMHSLIEYLEGLL